MPRFSLALFLLASTIAVPLSVRAEEITVKQSTVADPKIVFATIESTDVVPARARIGGTVIAVNVKEGDVIKAGQIIAVVGDEKLALQVKTLDAQISALSAQSAAANAELKRVKNLIDGGAVSKASLDNATSAAATASNQTKALQSQRKVIEQQVTEGKIVSPSSGRILSVPLVGGSVVMPGETIATVAAEDYVLRMSLPERHARYLKEGDKVFLDAGDMSKNNAPREGTIRLVYPQIENGRVTADAVVPGLENYFVGERVRVRVKTTERETFLIPKSYITTKSGADYVRLKTPDNKEPYLIPVQTGDASETDRTIEILSGVKVGDILVSP